MAKDREMGDQNGEEEVNRWNDINNEVERVMRRAVISREATASDKSRIERETQEKLQQAEEEFTAQKTTLENQLSILRRENKNRKAENSEKEGQLEDLRKEQRLLQERQGAVQSAIAEAHVAILDADKSRDIALRKKKNAEENRAEKERLVEDAEAELAEARAAQASKEREHEEMVQRRRDLEAEMAQLEVYDQDLAATEQEVESQKKNAKDFEVQLNAQKNEELKHALVPFDQEMQDRLASREANLKAQYRDKLAKKGPDVDGIQRDIVAREQLLLEQKNVLFDLNRQVQDLEEEVGSVRKLQGEVDDVKQRVKQAERESIAFKAECDAEVERARVAFEKEQAKNLTNIRRQRLEEMRSKLEAKVMQMKEVLGATEDEVAGVQGSVDEAAADSVADVVTAGTQVVFEDVNPARRTFRLLNLQATAQALDGWTLTVLASGDEIICDLQGVVLPAKGYVLFSCGAVPVSESYVHLSVTTGWAAAGGQLLLSDPNGNSSARVVLGAL